MSEWVSLTSGEIDLIAQYPEVWNEVYDEECGCYNEELDEDKFARRIESALRHKNKGSQVPVNYQSVSLMKEYLSYLNITQLRLAIQEAGDFILKIQEEE